MSKSLKMSILKRRFSPWRKPPARLAHNPGKDVFEDGDGRRWTAWNFIGRFFLESTMGKSESEKRQLRAKIESAKSLIRELEGRNDHSSKEELRRQKEELKNLQFELDHG